MERDNILEERKKKFLGIIKKPSFWVVGFLILAMVLGAYIRSLPMQDHGGLPGLWDIAKNDWTLGPDLDPWLFTRQAKIISETGGIPEIDNMRFVNVGFETSKETKLLPYMIFWTWKVVNLFGDYSMEFAAAIFPVFMFVLTILAFFLFVRELFIGKDMENGLNANLISLISTFIMIVVPIFLSRTVAGIPEKESAIFFFMFGALYLFIKAWKKEELKHKVLFASLAGIATGLGGLISGLVIYIFIPLAIATLAMFILNKVDNKNIISYSCWTVLSILMMVLFSSRFSLKGLITSYTTGLSTIVLFILIVNYLLWHTKISKNKFIQRINLPKNIISIIISLIIGVLTSLILFGPEFLIQRLESLHQSLFKSITGRWNTTVAENRQPYFVEWVRNFGPYIQKIPVMFWLFIVSSVVLFKKILRKINKIDSWKLTGIYVLFLFGLIFSRYSSSSLFNGENFISKAIYYAVAILLVWSFVRTYIKYQKIGHKGFMEISFEPILLLILFVLSIFSARSAVRLIMVLAPIGSIFVGFLIVEMINKYFKSKDESMKKLFGILAVILIILGSFIFINFYENVKIQSYNSVPSQYNNQWQKAMSWVRTNTSEDAVFAHWWDYGYWVQSIGERATVSDGGNAITYWNYLMGRHVLTGDNQKDSLEFLYNHDVDYLLIDSSDIGKYGAFSSIGSDENFDRFSYISPMSIDPSQTIETSKGLKRIFVGQSSVDEDILYNLNGTEIFIPSGSSAIGGIIVETIEINGNGSQFLQPEAVFFDRKNQYRIPLRYLEYEGNFIDFGSGIEGAVKIIQSFQQSPGGLSMDNFGGAIYISPRLLRGYLAQKYLLEDPFDNFGQFEIIHVESNIIVESLRAYGAPTREFILFSGRLQGPISIWGVNYLGDEEYKEEYTDRDPTKYISWEL